MIPVHKVLSRHRQLNSWSCSASAHEFIAKLHGMIQLDAFPLQTCQTSHMAGYQFENFLALIGFKGKEVYQAPEQAIVTLHAETSHGRYPLVSLLVNRTSASTSWHIMIAVPIANEVGLVDPASQNFATTTSDATRQYMEAVSTAVPARPMIHLLTYALKDNRDANTVS